MAKNVTNGNMMELAENINCFFHSVTSHLTPISKKVARVQPEFHPADFIITVTQVEKALQKLDISKSSGPDGIPAWILKQYASFLAYPLASIMNSSIREAYVPSQWKEADIVAIPKVTCPIDITSHLRPISLTPIISKIMEGFVLKWLMDDIKPHIDPNQYGGLPTTSVVIALIEMYHQWITFVEDEKDVRVVLLDFAKAFDLVDRNILLEKLKNLGANSLLVDWICSFLCDRKQRVKLNNITTTWKSVCGGMPQGTKIGPICFVTHINDLNTSSKCIKYMDDTTIYNEISTTDIDKIPQSLQQVCDWAEENKMVINPSKSKEFVISFKHQTINLQELKIKDKAIEKVKIVKILGVLFQDNLEWDAHVDHMIKKSSTKIYFLIQLRRAGADVKALLIEPVWKTGFLESDPDLY